MSRRPALTLVLALLVAFACGGASGGGKPQTASASPATCTPGTQVKIAVPVTPPNVVHAPPYVAQDLGYFKDEGLTVQLPTFEGGVGAFRSMAAGSVDMAGSSSEPAIAAVSQGADVKAVYTYGNAVESSFVVRGDIQKPSDLKGKNIGIQEPNGFSDEMSRYVLKKYGISPSDVHFVTTTTAGRVTQLAAGTVDTGILHVDQLLRIQKQDPTIHVLANMWDVVKTYQYSFFMVSGNTLKTNPALAECMVRALIRADRALYDPSKRTQILAILTKYTKEDPDVVAQTYDELVKVKVWPQNEGLVAANVNGTIAALKSTNQITTNTKFSDVVDLTIANKVVNQLGRVNFPY